MAQHEQQPEDAVTRPAAAAASFAGSFTQTRMYGTALGRRGASGKQPGQDGEPAGTAAGTNKPQQGAKTATAPATEPPAGDDPELAQLIERLEPPAGHDPKLTRLIQRLEEPATGPAAAGAGDSEAIDPELVAACSAQDVAAAAARLDHGQVEPPTPGPAAAPAPGPGQLPL
jgi:hypothetical protein